MSQDRSIRRICNSCYGFAASDITQMRRHRNWQTIMTVQKVAVVGAGLMGHGIAQIIAQNAQFSVNLVDVEQRYLERGMTMIRDSLERFAARAQVNREDIPRILGRIKPTTDLAQAVSEAEFVIEAVPESEKLKLDAFRSVDELAPADAYLASNTSSISITLLASATRRPEKVCGMHFFNPPQLMKLVEIIRGERTSDETLQVSADLARRMGKEPVIVKKDTPGFIVNRVLMPALNEATFLVEEGVADVSEIDKAIKLGLNWPMGPLELLDYIGIDTSLAIGEVLSRETGDPKFRPSQLLRRMVRAGLLGRKAGKGFHSWERQRT